MFLFTVEGKNTTRIYKWAIGKAEPVRIYKFESTDNKIVGSLEKLEKFSYILLFQSQNGLNILEFDHDF